MSQQTAWYLFFCWSLLLFSCRNDYQEAVEIAELDVVSVEQGEQIEILQTEDGWPSIKIKAKKAYHYLDKPPYTEFVDGMKLYVFGDSMEIESVLTANYGKMTDGSSEMIAHDNVVVTNATGEILNAEHLVWNQKEKKIYSNEFVKITTEDEIIYGSGFEADENFTNYTISNISGTVKIKDDGFL